MLPNILLEFNFYLDLEKVVLLKEFENKNNIYLYFKCKFFFEDVN